MKRVVGGRRPRKTFLIVCEGAKTEKLYFDAFKLTSVQVEGTGKNTLSVVEEAIRLREGYDEVWCVFDRDSFPAQNFNAAIEKASQAGLRVAYSNEAFEIWYLLHFDFHTSALSRTLYAEKLSERLGRAYKKNDPTIFEALRPLQAQAMTYARKLLASYPQTQPPSRTTPAPPSTCLSRNSRSSRNR